MKILVVEFANRVEGDEMTHNEPPHLDLHCLPSLNTLYDITWMKHFVLNIAGVILLSSF